MTASFDYAVEAHGLEKSFGDWPVLWDLELTVKWGEILVLLGANGVGKTTLLRVLSTQAKADGGVLRMAGYDPRKQADAIRRRVGVVFHQTMLYQDLTCHENLLYYGRLFGLKTPRQRAAEALDRVGLADRAERRVRTLSNGMQKRLAIARAVLHTPPILLLDEPETGLDRDSAHVLKELLQEWTGVGRTVVMTTHDLDLGLAWASRVGVLSQGKVHYPVPAEGLADPELRDTLAESLGPTR